MQESSNPITSPKVVILLPVYNGEKYLAAQLDSLLKQSYSNFLIIIRDDCSTDSSPELMKQYKERYPEQFHIVANEQKNLGASGSFAFLIQYVLQHKSELKLQRLYLLFCDQDDRWFENKIKIQLEAMLNAEAAEQSLPLLIHSDLQVVSDSMKSIAPSLVKYQGLEIERNTFPNLVISNLVTGCTALINEPLAEKCLPIPDDAIMHDWWLALIASAFGKLIYLDQTLVYYRQHANNTIGAKEFVRPATASFGFWQRILSSKANPHLIEVGTQANRFRQCFGSQLGFRNKVALVFCGGMKIRVELIQRIFYRIARRF